MSIHYDADYHRAITGAGETGAVSRWLRRRQQILRYKQRGTILDVGCSSGAFLVTMKGDDWQRYGIEINVSTAARASSLSHAEVFVGEALDAPYAAESFDVITCFDVLEHVCDPLRFLARVHQWLKPGGIVYLVLPNIDSWESRLFRSYWYGLELPRHLFHFSPQSLRGVMSSLSFLALSLATNTSYFDRSMGYLYSSALDAAGFTPVPASALKPSSLALRAVEKIFRLTVVSALSRTAAAAAAGASIEAVFEKRIV